MAQAARKYVKQYNYDKQNNTQVSVLEIQKKKYRRREKTALWGSLVWVAALGCFTITSSTNVNSAQNRLQNITSEVTSISNKNSNIKQEVSELSSRSRLTGIAKKDGLSLNEQNTRNVTK